MPSVARLDLNITYKGNLLDEWTSTVQASSVGVTMGWNVHAHLSLEATAGFVIPTTRLVDDPVGGGIKRADVAGGEAFMGLVRYAAFTTPTGRQALTIAGGGYAVLSDAYGPVLFVHTDVAFEYRTSFFTVLVGYGLNIAANASDRLPSLCGGPACEVGFDKGDVLPHLHVGVGTTF